MTAIVLLAPKNITGKAIDALTGGHGFSHCLVDPAWGGVPHAVIDVSIEDGVQISTWDVAVGDRKFCRIELDPLVGARLVDGLMGIVGQRFDILAAIGVLTGKPNLCHGVYCSAVIAAFLPFDVRARLPPCVSPSDLLELGGAVCSVSH